MELPHPFDVPDALAEVVLSPRERHHGACVEGAEVIDRFDREPRDELLVLATRIRLGHKDHNYSRIVVCLRDPSSGRHFALRVSPAEAERLAPALEAAARSVRRQAFDEDRERGFR